MTAAILMTSGRFACSLMTERITSAIAASSATITSASRPVSPRACRNSDSFASRADLEPHSGSRSAALQESPLAAARLLATGAESAYNNPLLSGDLDSATGPGESPFFSTF